MRKIAEAVALLLVVFIAAATAWAVVGRILCRTGFRRILTRLETRMGGAAQGCCGWCR